MIDYGIVALLVIQLAACAGGILAWSSMRREADRITSTHARMETQIEQMGRRVVDVVELKGRVTACEEFTRTSTAQAETHANRAAKEASGAAIRADELGVEVKSVRASINAMKRWNREDATPDPEPPPEPPQPPQHQPQRESTFGRSAV